EKMDNPIARVTWQVSPRNKFAAYNDRAMRLRGHAMTALLDPNTASVVWHTPTFATGSAKWTSTVTPRLLVEGGVSFNRERYDNANADLYQTYQNLQPLRITVLNTPLEVEEYLDSNLGIYGQDSWRLDKFTINFGVRYDHVKQHIVGQTAQIGRFANLIPYDD